MLAKFCEVVNLLMRLQPPLQPVPVLLQKEGAGAEAFAEDSVRLRVAGSPCDPLGTDFVLGCSKPALREDLDQPCMEVEDEQRHGGIVRASCGVSCGNYNFLNIAQFCRNLNAVCSRRKL